MEELAPTDIRPRHNVHDSDKVARIAADMREHGWQGRPLLVWEDRALTGTHRIAAAKAAGLSRVPARVIDGAASEALAERTDIYGRLGCDDEDVLIILRDVLGADDERTQLMAREMVANGGSIRWMAAQGVDSQ